VPPEILGNWLVGAPGFETGDSCAEARRVPSCKAARRRELAHHDFWHWPPLRLTGTARLATTRFPAHFRGPT
jgi:hypothetical protein